MENTVQFPPIPVSILGLSDVEIVSVTIDRDNQFIFKVTSTKKEIICRCCGKPVEPNGYSQTILLRHLPILGRKTFIEITPARGRCKDWLFDTSLEKVVNANSANFYETVIFLKNQLCFLCIKIIKIRTTINI